MKLLSMFLFLIIVQNVYSQNRKLYEKDSARIQTCPVKIMEFQHGLTSAKEEMERFPFGCFSIIDVRADTTTIGIEVKSKSFSLNNFIVN